MADCGWACAPQVQDLMIKGLVEADDEKIAAEARARWLFRVETKPWRRPRTPSVRDAGCNQSG